MVKGGAAPPHRRYGLYRGPGREADTPRAAPLETGAAVALVGIDGALLLAGQSDSR